MEPSECNRLHSRQTVALAWKADWTKKMPFALWLQPISFFVFYHSADVKIQLLLIRRLKACKSAAGIYLHLQFSLIISKLNLVGCICRPMIKKLCWNCWRKGRMKASTEVAMVDHQEFHLPGQYDPCGEQDREYFFEEKNINKNLVQKGVKLKFEQRTKKGWKKWGRLVPSFPPPWLISMTEWWSRGQRETHLKGHHPHP